jgi:hypothetical protein
MDDWEIISNGEQQMEGMSDPFQPKWKTVKSVYKIVR